MWVLRMATSGPTGTPDVPGLVSAYVAGGLEMGMHSVIPYEGKTAAPKVSLISWARLGRRPPAALAIILRGYDLISLAVIIPFPVCRMIWCMVGAA